MPSAVAFAWIAAHRAQDRVDRRARERLRELADEERALVGLVHEPEQRERRGRAAARTRAARSTRSSRPGACRDRRRTCSRPASLGGSMLGPMDAAQAIADLTEISPQIRRGRRRRRRRLGRRLELRRRGGRRAARRRRAAARRRGRARSGRTSRSSRRRRVNGSVFVVRDGEPPDRRDDDAGADGRARLLRPEDLPALGRRGAAEARRRASGRRRRTDDAAS